MAEFGNQRLAMALLLSSGRGDVRPPTGQPTNPPTSTSAFLYLGYGRFMCVGPFSAEILGVCVKRGVVGARPDE